MLSYLLSTKPENWKKGGVPQAENLPGKLQEKTFCTGFINNSFSELFVLKKGCQNIASD